MKKTILLICIMLVAPFSRAQASSESAPLLGQSVTLNAVVQAGTKPFTYQWYKDGVKIQDAVNDHWYIPSMSAKDVGNYTVVVTNQYGSTTSTGAAISVSVPVAAPSGGSITIVLGPKPAG